MAHVTWERIAWLITIYAMEVRKKKQVALQLKIIHSKFFFFMYYTVNSSLDGLSFKTRSWPKYYHLSKHVFVSLIVYRLLWLRVPKRSSFTAQWITLKGTVTRHTPALHAPTTAAKLQDNFRPKKFDMRPLRQLFLNIYAGSENKLQIIFFNHSLACVGVDRIKDRNNDPFLEF